MEISQVLEAYSLPTGTITENDLSKVKTTIQQALGKISESIKPDGNRLDLETIKSCILAFQDWLRNQGCVSEASTTYDIETTDKYSENIFITHPGQLPIDIVFNIEGDHFPYRLLIFVSRIYLFDFGSLVENKSLAGIAAPKSWPKDPWSYWDDRPEVEVK